jgi:hypothetical protein
LARAWRTAEYRAGGVAFRVGRRDPALDRLIAPARAAILIGAWNPMGRRMPAEWNRRAHRALEARLRRADWMLAEGGSARWREDHALVLGPSVPVLRLARLFRQGAVVALARGRPPRLLILAPQGTYAASSTDTAGVKKYPP